MKYEWNHFDIYCMNSDIVNIEISDVESCKKTS